MRTPAADADGAEPVTCTADRRRFISRFAVATICAAGWVLILAFLSAIGVPISTTVVVVAAFGAFIVSFLSLAMVDARSKE